MSLQRPSEFVCQHRDLAVLVMQRRNRPGNTTARLVRAVHDVYFLGVLRHSRFQGDNGMRKNCILVLLAAVCCGIAFGGDLLVEESVTIMGSDRSKVASFSGTDIETGQPTRKGEPVSYLGVETFTIHGTAASLVAQANDRRGTEHFVFRTDSGAEVLVSQPEGFEDPDVSNTADGAIFNLAPIGAMLTADQNTNAASNPLYEILAARCRACSTQPHACADLEIWDCLSDPLCAWCYKCVSWQC